METPDGGGCEEVLAGVAKAGIDVYALAPESRGLEFGSANGQQFIGVSCT